MRKIASAILLFAALAIPVVGAVVEHGKGAPDLGGWCKLDWLAPCISGVSSLGTGGLVLSNVTAPPRASYELELKLLPYDSLLFRFRTQSPVGHVLVYLDGEVIERLAVQQGEWWIRLSQLPPQGLLRLELDRYCKELVIESVYFPCRCTGRPVIPPPSADCTQAFRSGVIVGLAVTTAVVLLFYMATR